MDSPEAHIAPDLTGSVITARDIEELEGSVFPWRLDMRQVSGGTLDARIHLGQVDDVLVTREHWSRKIVSAGATPAGYLALAGAGSSRTFKWCGHEIDSRHVLCGLDSAEVDFATAEQQVHWVLLVPQERLANYVGEGAVEALAGRRVLRCPPSLSRRLASLAKRAVAPSRGRNSLSQGPNPTKALRADLLEAAALLVTGSDRSRRRSGQRQRYRACCHAIAYGRGLHVPIGVGALAREVGVSRRTLERAFSETLGISPYRYLRLQRLNALHRDLRSGHPGRKSVTALSLNWGFSELGRTAGEYKRLFGESPSATLAEESSSPGLRLADALLAASGSASMDL